MYTCKCASFSSEFSIGLCSVLKAMECTTAHLAKARKITNKQKDKNRQVDKNWHIGKKTDKQILYMPIVISKVSAYCVCCLILATQAFFQLSFPWGSSQSLTMQCSSVKDLMQSFPRCSSQGLAMYCTPLKDLAQQRSFLLFQLKSHSPSVQVFNRMLTRRNVCFRIWNCFKLIQGYKFDKRV